MVKLLLMMLAGLFFGTWPLLMNRCGMKANTFTTLAIMVTLVCVFPFFLKEFDLFQQVKWKYVIGAFVAGTAVIGVILVFVFPFFLKEFDFFQQVNWRYAISAFVTGTAGVIIFNNILALATKEEIAYLFLAMTMVQVSVPAIYGIFMNGGLTVKNVFGLICAIAAVWAFS